MKAARTVRWGVVGKGLRPDTTRGETHRAGLRQETAPRRLPIQLHDECRWTNVVTGRSQMHISHDHHTHSPFRQPVGARFIAPQARAKQCASLFARWRILWLICIIAPQARAKQCACPELRTLTRKKETNNALRFARTSMLAATDI